MFKEPLDDLTSSLHGWIVGVLSVSSRLRYGVETWKYSDEGMVNIAVFRAT